MEDNTCVICAENYNRSNRKLVKCQYCEFMSCSACCRTYLLSQPVVKCMNNSCNREWTRQYTRDVMPLTFINKELKQHREKMLFDQERALMPATQPTVEYRKNRAPMLDEQSRIKRQIAELKEKLHDNIFEISRLDRQYARDMGDNQAGGGAAKREAPKFIRACPSENCRGFLNTDWKCGLCSNYTCSKCHVVKGPEKNTDQHTCNKDDVATAELLNKDTKPCPNCGMGIFRIMGCDQMFCTECHTAFDWRTGRVETENIHNPHYFEWARRNGTLERNPRDILCGREIDRIFITRIAYDLDHLNNYNRHLTDDEKKTNKKSIDLIVEICRNVVHIRFVLLQNYQYNYEANNRELRIQYMMNQICEALFKSRLHAQNKKNHRTLEIRNILRLTIDTLTDIIYRFNQTMVVPRGDLNFAVLNDVLNEIEEFRNYVNECFGDISHTYNSIQLKFDNKFNLDRVKKEPKESQNKEIIQEPTGTEISLAIPK